jgi:hypothetical protein
MIQNNDFWCNRVQHDTIQFLNLQKQEAADKYLTWQERLSREKHSSLLGLFVSGE